MKKPKLSEIKEYDNTDTTSMINPKKKLSLKSLGFELPSSAPTQVVSIRLPTRLLNQIRAKASLNDIPYQALIKSVLARSFGKNSI